MLEYIITFLIVGVVLALALRSLYRTLKYGKSFCSCASAKGGCARSGSCHSHQNKKTIQ